GYLDDFFVQIEDLASNDNPYFVEEIFTLFFRDNETLLPNIQQEMEKSPVDFVGLNRILHQLKGTSSSIGATKVKAKTNETVAHCKEENLESAKASFQELKGELECLKEKLGRYFQMLRQAGPDDKAMPPQ
ncbi:hypothetical protein Tsubulata_033652, partial [Turnera subulata]